MVTTAVAAWNSDDNTHILIIFCSSYTTLVPYLACPYQTWRAGDSLAELSRQHQEAEVAEERRLGLLESQVVDARTHLDSLNNTHNQMSGNVTIPSTLPSLCAYLPVL